MSAGTKNGGADYNPPSRGAVEMACQMKDELLKKVEDLGKRLPANTLDELIDQLGGTENVAEVGPGRFWCRGVRDSVKKERKLISEWMLLLLKVSEMCVFI